MFRRLSRDDMVGIVDIQLAQLEKLLEDRKVTLEIDAEAKKWLANAGYDPVYGARPLKRVIQRELQNPLAEKILAGEIRDGDTVRVTASPLGLLLQPVNGTTRISKPNATPRNNGGPSPTSPCGLGLSPLAGRGFANALARLRARAGVRGTFGGTLCR